MITNFALSLLEQAAVKFTPNYEGDEEVIRSLQRFFQEHPPLLDQAVTVVTELVTNQKSADFNVKVLNLFADVLAARATQETLKQQ